MDYEVMISSTATLESLNKLHNNDLVLAGFAVQHDFVFIIARNDLDLLGASANLFVDKRKAELIDISQVPFDSYSWSE